MTSPTWINSSGEEIDLEKHYGFIYEIRNDSTGKKYIGRKYFTLAKTVQVKGKKKKTRESSGWENYWGSNKLLLEDVELLGKDKFTRTIIKLCCTRSECSYYESKEIFMRDALLDNNYYNQWISCRIQSAHLKQLVLNHNQLENT